MVGSGVVQERASVRGKEGSWWPGLMARDACGSCGAWLLGRPTLKLACRRGTPPPLHVRRPHHTSNLSTSLFRSLRGPLPPLSMEDVGKIQGRPLTEQSLGWAAIHTPPCAASRRCHLPALSPPGTCVRLSPAPPPPSPLWAYRLWSRRRQAENGTRPEGSSLHRMLLLCYVPVLVSTS